MHKKAVVLLSGGMDSATCLALAKDQGYQVIALSFDYGQRHIAELNAAKNLAAGYANAHKIIQLDIGQFGGSALTDHSLTVPTDTANDNANSNSIPITYVPARNTVFLSYALALAEVIQAFDIFIGVNAVDYSGYPDCRPEYIDAYAKMANLATKAGIEGKTLTIHTPLIDITKAEIIQLGHGLGVDYSLTVSCYQANDSGEACGQCDACRLRRQGFEDAGIEDQTRYILMRR